MPPRRDVHQPAEGGKRPDEPRPAMGRPGWYPDHAAERREELARTTPGERVAEAIELSKLATSIAAANARR